MVAEGYKQTEIGVFPEDWIVKSLGTLGLFSKGSGVKKDESNSGNLPCVRYGELYTYHNDYVKKFNSFISNDVAKRAKKLTCGDILFAGSGETKKEIGKSVAFLDSFTAYAGGDIVILSPRNINSKFLGYLLNIPLVSKQKASKGQGDAVVHISASSLADIQIPIPSTKPEQQAIATALSDTDALIDALEKLIAKKEAIKIGTMQELLTGKKRLDGFSGEWVEKKLGDVALLSSSKRIYFSEYVSDGIPFYRGKEISELKNKTKIENILYISKSKYLQIKQQYGIPVKNDILLTAVGTLGNIYRVDSNKEFYFKDGNLIWLKDITINSMFLEYILTYFKQAILDTAIGSSQKALTIKNLNTMLLKLPILNKEQTAIATILSDMDKEIEALSSKLSKVKAIKEGMMQELLTGKTRLMEVNNDNT